MKKIISLVLAGLFLNVQAQTLKISTDGAYPPFSEVNDKGEMIGFDIEIGKALCAEMKRECEFVQTDWDGLIPALQTKKIDVILASMNATEERKKSVLFSDAYYTNPGIFARAKGSTIELTDEGLKGKVVGVLKGSTFDYYVSDKFKTATIQRYNTQEEANLDAIAGRVDVLMADLVVLQDGFLLREEGQKFEAFGEPVNDETYFGGIAIGVRLDDKELVESLNKALQAIKDNGEYKKINDQFFKYDVSGGSAK